MVFIGPVNALSPTRWQAIAWTNDYLWSMGSLKWISVRLSSQIQHFIFNLSLYCCGLKCGGALPFISLLRFRCIYYNATIKVINSNWNGEFFRHDDVIKWNHFCVTGPLCGEFTGLTGEFPELSSVTRSFDVFFICVWINDWVNNREVGDLNRHRAHYDVIVMVFGFTWIKVYCP